MREKSSMWHYGERVLILVLLMVALWLWWPLMKWQRLFEFSAQVNFGIPPVQSLDFHAMEAQMPALPTLTVLQVNRLSPDQQQWLSRHAYPLFQKGTVWWIGPYLTTAQAQQQAQQIRQLLKIPVTILDYRAG